MRTDAKFLHKILASQMQQYINRIEHYDQVAFIPRIELVCTRKPIKINHNISIDVEKGSDTIQYLFVMKILSNLILKKIFSA